MAREIPTFHDAILNLERFAARRGTGAAQGDLRAAIIDAYQELCDRYPWSFNRKLYRVNIEAPQTTGTVAYTASTRTLTLSGATWPTDASEWTVVIDDVFYDVERYSSSTELILDSDTAPTADVAAGETFELYRRYYLLPDDFVSCDDPMPSNTSTILGAYVPIDEVIRRMRVDTSSGSARVWSIGPAPNLHGRVAIYMQPPNSSAETVDLWYRKYPRPLRYSGLETRASVGTIAVTAASAAVTGTSTTFESGMVGSAFRIGDDTTQPPGGLASHRPWMEQHFIYSFSSTTSVTLVDTVTTSRSGVKYTVTDPLDLDTAAVPALYRLSERNLSQFIGGKEVAKDERRAEQAIQTARGASNRVAMRGRIAGEEAMILVRPADGTFSFDDGGAV